MQNNSQFIDRAHDFLATVNTVSSHMAAAAYKRNVDVAKELCHRDGDPLCICDDCHAVTLAHIEDLKKSGR